MAVTLPVRHTEVSVDQLVRIYSSFCEAYEINMTDRDERFMRGLGIQALHEGHLDYRPFYGAKFFGERRGASTQFWGYTDIEDLDHARDRRFGEILLSRLGEKS